LTEADIENDFSEIKSEWRITLAPEKLSESGQ
jgi:hypothetical protein